jgi:hypothetical protein
MPLTSECIPKKPETGLFAFEFEFTAFNLPQFPVLIGSLFLLLIRPFIDAYAFYQF